MALSNIELDNLQAGDDVASDLVATDHYQIIKIAYGAAGTVNDVTSTATNPFPVALSDTDNAVLDVIAGDTTSLDGKVTACNTGAVVISSGTVTANLGATDNAVLDDIAAQNTTVAGAVAAGQMQVDIVADGAGLLTTTAHDAAFGTAGTADAQVRSIQGIASGTPVEVNLGTNNDVTATLDAETTKVIGTVNIAAAQTIAVTATNLDCQSGGADMATAAGQLADGHSVALSATDNAVLDDIAAKLAPHTTNGHSTYLNQDTSAIASVKGSAGTIYWISIQSIDATPVYLNLYDSTTATLGSTTPTNQFIVPTQGDANGSGLTLSFGPLGIQYSTGIQVAAATTFNGSTDPGTNVVITNIGYE